MRTNRRGYSFTIDKLAADLFGKEVYFLALPRVAHKDKAMFTCQFSRNGFLLFVLFSLNATSAQPKGYLYDEQKVGVANPLVCEDGSTVTDSMVWTEREILRLFEKVYGRSPRLQHIEFGNLKRYVALGGKAKRNKSNKTCKDDS